MDDRFNVRLLSVPSPDDLAHELARVESIPERVAASAAKGRLLVLHASGLDGRAAMVLKQELLAEDADCVISPEVYLGAHESITDAVIMATDRQYARLVPRLRRLPIDHLPQLGDEIERTLSSYLGQPAPLYLPGATFDWGQRTYVMGIVNVTPDSFSGDGLAAAPQADGSVVGAALAQARSFVEGGVHILDVGGESTRPGAGQVDAEEEQARVVPVIRALSRELDPPISVDTYKPEVAAAALDAGASIVNDVWGLRLPEGGWNESLAKLVASRRVPLILMHNRRAPASEASFGGHFQDVSYSDLWGELIADLRASIAFARSHGVDMERIIVDPGIGFGKTPAHNVEVLRRLGELRALGRPVLVGTSRKSFIGRVVGGEPDQRLEGTAATVALAIHAGADIVRVHDVGPMVKVARMTDAIVRPGAWGRLAASLT